MLELGDEGVVSPWTEELMGGLMFCCPFASLLGRSEGETSGAAMSKGVGAVISSGEVGAEISEA